MINFYTGVLYSRKEVGFFIYRKKGGFYMKIIKVINNTVCVLDENGMEQIVLGKCTASGKNAEKRQITDRIEKIYMIADSVQQKKLIGCMAEIPYEYIKAMGDIANYILERVNVPLIVTLSDHIAFTTE